MPRCPAFFQECWHTLCQCDTFQVLWHTFTPINTNKNRYYRYKQPCKILQSRWYNRQIWRIAGFFPVSSRLVRKRACALRRLSAPTNGCSCVIDFVLPSVACADDTVYTPGIWLDIKQGCAIQRVDIGDVQQIAFPGEQTDKAHANGIGTSRSTSGEYSVLNVLEKGFHQQGTRLCPVQMIEEGIRSGGNGVKPFLGVPMRMWPAQNSQTPTPCASVEQPARPARTWRDLEVVPADGC